MDYVIDIQGFYGLDGKFLPKEVAVVTMDHPYLAHWIVEPPYIFAALPPKQRSANNYVTCYYHGIDWFEGDITLPQLESHLRGITRNAHRIVTRGAEKTGYLQEVTSRQVINLEHEDCPSYGRLESTKEYCFFHGVKKEEFYNCAINNAMKLKKWVVEKHVLAKYKYTSHAMIVAGSTPNDRGTGRTVAHHLQHVQYQKKKPTSPAERKYPLTPSARNIYTPATETNSLSKPVLTESPRSPSPLSEGCSGLSYSSVDVTAAADTYSTAPSSPGGMNVSDNDKEVEEEEENGHSSDSGCAAGVKEWKMRGFCGGPDPPHLDTPDSLCCKHR